MKTILSLIILCMFSLIASSQTENAKYDKALADSLGADDYGMKPYVLVILKTGTAKVENKALSDSLFRGHIDNINRLAKDGKLVVAGPLKKNDKSYRGIFILNVNTLEEANNLLITDPAIKENVFDVETFIWYGSAALPLYLESHAKIEKKQI